MSEAIKVEGLSQFRRSLKALDSELPKALRMAFNEAANIVVDDAKPRVPHRSGKARGTVRAQSTQSKARVKGGGRKAPYYPWLDFGGRVGRKNSVKRPYLPKEGRYIYVAFNNNKRRFGEGLQDALLSVARRAGLEIT